MIRLANFVFLGRRGGQSGSHGFRLQLNRFFFFPDLMSLNYNTYYLGPDVSHSKILVFWALKIMWSNIVIRIVLMASFMISAGCSAFGFCKIV